MGASALYTEFCTMVRLQEHRHLQDFCQTCLDFKNTMKEAFVCFVLNMAQILVQHRKNSRTCIHINTQMASSAGFCSSRHSYFCLSSTCLLFFEQHAHYCSSTFAGMPTEHINVLEFLKSANVKSKI